MKRELINECAKLFGLEFEELIGRSQMRHVCRARFALYKALRIRGWSYVAIGRRLGGRHHTTIMYGVDRANYIMENNESYKNRVHRIAELQPEARDPPFLPPPREEPEPEPEEENYLKDFLYD